MPPDCSQNIPQSAVREPRIYLKRLRHRPAVTGAILLLTALAAVIFQGSESAAHRNPQGAYLVVDYNPYMCVTLYGGNENFEQGAPVVQNQCLEQLA
jgi:hypothetical protein